MLGRCAKASFRIGNELLNMSELKQTRTLKTNAHLFWENISTLKRLRPELNIVYGDSPNSVTFHLEGNGLSRGNIVIQMEKQNELIAYNSSIILNCYSLFESSFESILLKELNTKNLTGIQEKVMLKYIDNILKLSSETKYNEEHKFITGKALSDLFNETEKDFYKTIKIFYLLRHRLIHGSSTKSIFIKGNNGGQIILDQTDKEYQDLVQYIKTKIELKIPSEFANIEILLLDNRVADLIAEATNIIADKLFRTSGAIINFIDGNPFEDNF